MISRLLRGVLFWKYVATFVVLMSSALVASTLIEMWFTWHEHRSALLQLQQQQAAAAATRISQFIKDIEGQVGWTTHLSWPATSRDQRELDALRLLRQVPAISELALLDGQGREQLRVSRQAMDLVDSHVDYSNDERFRSAMANRVYYGPVYFRRSSEPFMTLAVAGARKDAGVSVAEINLAHIWDVVHGIRVGKSGRAYVVGPGGRLIAHPDISLVLRNTDLSGLPQVKAVRSSLAKAADRAPVDAFDLDGARVLTAYAHAEPLNWLVFVELPEQEANEPLYAAMKRTVLIAALGIGLALLSALLLARRMVVPIEQLSAGAARIGSGVLDHRIEIGTGDELQGLGDEFNRMAAQLQSSYATLERKVEERTAQLQVANTTKSRFLAVASHDLRQPLHALNLLAAQLKSERDPGERLRLASRIETAVSDMNELFNALLDISRLDAGGMTPSLSSFPISGVLRRIEATFSGAAHNEGLHFAVVQSSAVVRSDPILLERILLNLVSNAIRYTSEGGVVIGCRLKGNTVRIDVCDTGPGVPDSQHRSIFAEFFRGARSERSSGEGLGLGLAIVERLCALLEHPIHLDSRVGKGSRFSVTLPLGSGSDVVAAPTSPAADKRDPLIGRLIFVIDDDALVRESMASLLKSWGCRVVSEDDADSVLEESGSAAPDLIISDFWLKDGRTGLEAVSVIRERAGVNTPAFLVSGDVAPERQGEARAHGLRLLHKPVPPLVLRAMMSSLLK